jgi:uncharacterized protein (TIGR04255 family)
VKFKKPPVVEVGISFTFDPNEKKREWNLQLVQEYVQKYSSQLPKLEVLREQQIEVQESSATELPKVVSRQQKVRAARIFNEDKSKVLQVFDDKTSFHILKTESGYPGYSAVRDEALQMLGDYVELFQPARIRNAAIHYVDFIEIPRPPEGKIEVADYFVGSADLPESTFGLIADLSVQFVIACPVDPGPLVLQLMTIPSNEASGAMQFLMNWQKECVGLNSLDLAAVRVRLDVAHDYLTACFAASLTRRTLDLFEPIAED